MSNCSFHIVFKHLSSQQLTSGLQIIQHKYHITFPINFLHQFEEVK